MALVEIRNRIGHWLDGFRWSRRHREIRRFLATWSFAISEPGFIYARAETNTLTPHELNMFLSRLKAISNESFPRMVMLNMAGASITNRHWRIMRGALKRFSSDMGAHLITDLLEESRINYAAIWRDQRENLRIGQSP